ncbi:uncharacterized protein LOC135398708 [Ornithodoros turicata]|uniref:uncharacterized protein LOC135398708 n=1 Tax=Ornithodoros turicata TaxID=34597 RepID=UPI0031389768
MVSNISKRLSVAFITFCCMRRQYRCRTMRKNCCKSVLGVTLLLALTAIATTLYARTTGQSETQSSANASLISTTGCRIPDFPIFTSATYRSYRRLPATVCTGKPSFIKRRDDVLEVDKDILFRVYNLTPEEIICYYSKISRHEKDDAPDKSVLLKAKSPLYFGIPLQDDYFLLSCQKDSATFHKEFFMMPVLKRDVESRCSEAEKQLPPSAVRHNVLVLGLSSVSRINSHRHLVKTRRYLMEDLKSIELLGYNKVGDGGFSNQVPILTGLREQDVPGGSFFDSLDFVWKKYAALGYRTLFLEESPVYGLFHYRAKGFSEPPTDYHPRSILLAMEMLLPSKNSHKCYGTNQSETDFSLNYTLSLLKFPDGHPLFGYTWLSSVTKHDVNAPSKIDAMLKKFFQELQKSGVLHKTIVIFLSDHGMRASHADAMENLERNQHRLTTPFDVHATLMELADLTSGLQDADGSRRQGKQQSKRTTFQTTFGLSLLHEIPESRTCKDAFVSQHWCACHPPGGASPTKRDAHLMVEFLLQTINDWLKESHPVACDPLLLADILNVEERRFEGEDEGHKYFTIAVRTNPKDATFEATIQTNRTEGMNLIGVSRIDKYDRTCVRDRVMEMYCTC